MTAQDDLAAKLGPTRFSSWKWIVSGTPREHHERHAEVLLDVIADRPVRVTPLEVSLGIRFPNQQIVRPDEVAPFLPEHVIPALATTDEITRQSDRRLIDELLRSIREMQSEKS
jgi:hypothetical protein